MAEYGWLAEDIDLLSTYVTDGYTKQVLRNASKAIREQAKKIRELRSKINASDKLDKKEKALKQVYWERDIALYQLAEIGKSLGEKMDDVVERRHGKWLYTPTHWVYCSECGKEPPDECNIASDFCPNCGADMRGEKDGNIM